MAVEISVSSIDYGRKPALLAVMRDVTAHQEAEASLRLLEKAIVSSPLGIVITDLKGQIIYANQGYLDILGKPKTTDLTGTDAMKADFGKEIGPQIMEQLQIQGFFSGEYSRYRSDGRLIDVHILATLVSDEKGNPTRDTHDSAGYGQGVDGDLWLRKISRQSRSVGVTGRNRG